MSAGQTLHLIFLGEQPDGTEVLVQVWGEDDAGPDGEVSWTSELAFRRPGASTWGSPVALEER